MTGAGPARPLQAAGVSAVQLRARRDRPAPRSRSSPPAMLGSRCSSSVALVVLAVLGVVGGRLGGAPMARAAARVLVGGGLAMALTALIGDLVGTAV